jgi:hypothetical protein
MQPTTEPAPDETVTVRLSENERAALHRLTAEKRLTGEQLLRLALATYEAVDRYRMTHNEPMPWERRDGREPFGAGLVE